MELKRREFVGGAALAGAVALVPFGLAKSEEQEPEEELQVGDRVVSQMVHCEPVVAKITRIGTFEEDVAWNEEVSTLWRSLVPNCENELVYEIEPEEDCVLTSSMLVKYTNKLMGTSYRQEDHKHRAGASFIVPSQFTVKHEDQTG